MDFEQSGFIGGLSNKSYWRTSNKLYRKIIQQILSEACLTNLFSKGCPMNFDIRDSLMSFQKQKSFVFENSFSYMEKACVRELART